MTCLSCISVRLKGGLVVQGLPCLTCAGEWDVCLRVGLRRRRSRSLRYHTISFARRSEMDKVHIDKKGKVDTGSIATQISTAGAPKDHAIKEVPGILEEGKVFFFYRRAPAP